MPLQHKQTHINLHQYLKQPYMFVQVYQLAKVNNVKWVFFIIPASKADFILKNVLNVIMGWKDIHASAIVKSNARHSCQGMTSLQWR